MINRRSDRFHKYTTVEFTVLRALSGSFCEMTVSRVFIIVNSCCARSFVNLCICGVSECSDWMCCGGPEPVAVSGMCWVGLEPVAVSGMCCGSPEPVAVSGLCCVGLEPEPVAEPEKDAGAVEQVSSEFAEDMLQMALRMATEMPADDSAISIEPSNSVPTETEGERHLNVIWMAFVNKPGCDLWRVGSIVSLGHTLPSSKCVGDTVKHNGGPMNVWLKFCFGWQSWVWLTVVGLIGRCRLVGWQRGGAARLQAESERDSGREQASQGDVVARHRAACRPVAREAVARRQHGAQVHVWGECVAAVGGGEESGDAGGVGGGRGGAGHRAPQTAQDRAAAVHRRRTQLPAVSVHQRSAQGKRRAVLARQRLLPLPRYVHSHSEPHHGFHFGLPCGSTYISCCVASVGLVLTAFGSSRV